MTIDSAQSVTATFVSILSSGQLVTGISGLAGSVQSFAISVPSGATTLTVRITGGVGEVELYARLGALATGTEYDCYQNGVASELICVIENPQAGSYFVTIVGITNFSGISLQSSYVTEPGYACSPDEDFVLTYGPQPGGILEVQGCRTITVEAGATVGGTSQLVLAAAERIRFGAGFRVKGGGRLNAAIRSGSLSVSVLSSDEEPEAPVLAVAATEDALGSAERSEVWTEESFSDGSGRATTGTLATGGFDGASLARTLDLASLCAEAPAEVTAVAGDQSVRLTWTAVPEGDGYYAYWSLSPGIHPATAASYLGFASVEGAPVLVVEGLENDQEHYFVVTVSCGGAESAPSVEVTATPRPGRELVAGRYKLDDVAEGTVEDVVTGLQWMRCALGHYWDGETCVGYADTHTYESALQVAEMLNAGGGLGGYSDWLVPTLGELQSLVYCSSGVPAPFKGEDPSICQGSHGIPTLAPEVFPPDSVREGWFWSATLDDPDGYQAWGVDFIRGDSHSYPGTVRGGVRLVRRVVPDDG